MLPPVPQNDPSFPPSSDAPQVMVTNVTSLLKTVKAVEDEATKGTRALEATTEHIRQELAVSASLGHRGLGSESRVVIDGELAPHTRTHTQM